MTATFSPEWYREAALRKERTRAAGRGRAVWGHVMSWESPTRIEPAKGEPYVEHFTRGSLRMPPGRRPGFWLRHGAHGGTRVGEVVALYNTPQWGDCVAVVDEGEAGDAVLDALGADGGRVPLSAGFEPVESGTVRYRGPSGLEVQRNLAWLAEVAMVDTAAYPGSYVFAVGTLASITQAAAGPRRPAK